ncbi:MAG: energy-coupling factor transporter transmembrane protein EcfT [Desulfobacterales bacterium]|nr:energy-coupling factor transporter transmembrane protein EcfT [Desulfobacterales bacterium]
MAELTSFGFISGNSGLHRLDARFKITCMIFLSLVSIKSVFFELGILTILTLGIILNARLPLGSGLKELRYFLILLIFVFIARMLSTAGAPLISYKFITISMRGITDGILVCWRLALIAIFGFAFISTTRPSAIKASVQWFLKPVPIIPEKRVAVMMGLILRFIPVIFDQAREIVEAQKARGVENRKNPVYRLTKLGFPLMRRTFERADELGSALEARCFTENRTDPELVSALWDWVTLATVSCLCLLMMLL